jgi:biotin transporter BioY
MLGTVFRLLLRTHLMSTIMGVEFGYLFSFIVGSPLAGDLLRGLH